jgi:hypothetical protein
MTDDLIPDDEELSHREDTREPEYVDAEVESMLHLSYLFDSSVRVDLIDWFLTDAPEQAISKSEIARKCDDVSRNSVAKHIDLLVEYGVVATEGEKRLRYKPAIDSPIYRLLRDINIALEDAYQGRLDFE